VKHHWGSKRSKCQVATLYGSCVNLSMENDMPFVHHVVKQWGCGRTIEDDKGLNERTQIHLIMKPMSKLM